MNRAAITREDIVEAENKLFSAILASNVEVLDQLLHEDLLAVAANGQIVTKEMDMNSHRAGTMIIEDASSEIEEIRIIEDNAVSIVSLKARGKMMGAPLQGHFRYIRIWKVFDGTLKIIGASFIQLTP